MIDFRTLATLARLLATRGRNNASEIYGLLADNHTLGKRSLYLNLGYWKHADRYDDACEALAELVADAAEIRAGCRVLDLGFGFGDQDLLWAERRKPARIVGFNVTASHVEKACRRVRECGLEHVIDLRVGSAVSLPRFDEPFDSVVAIESAHHFDTREEFFRQAFRTLRPGGWLATADCIPLPPRADVTVADRVAAFLDRAFWQVPVENMYDRFVYAAKLREAGFVDVSVESIRHDVVSPFYAFFRERLEDASVAAKANPLIHRLFRYGARREPATDYVLARARKP